MTLRNGDRVLAHRNGHCGAGAAWARHRRRLRTGQPAHPRAERFATNNTETIADPVAPRLKDRLEPFASQVDGTILANAALGGSDLVYGVFGQKICSS
jgi:hypothetical protein